MSSASKIGFIGAGNMAEAIIKGLAGNGKAKPDISAYDPNEERLHLLEQSYGVRAAASNSDLVKSCDIIFLAVKPQIFGKVLKEINTEFSAAKLLLSIMAGISTARIEEQLSGAAQAYPGHAQHPGPGRPGGHRPVRRFRCTKGGYGYGRQPFQCHRPPFSRSVKLRWMPSPAFPVQAPLMSFRL